MKLLGYSIISDKKTGHIKYKVAHTILIMSRTKMEIS